MQSPAHTEPEYAQLFEYGSYGGATMGGYDDAGLFTPLDACTPLPPTSPFVLAGPALPPIASAPSLPAPAPLDDFGFAIESSVHAAVPASYDQSSYWSPAPARPAAQQQPTPFTPSNAVGAHASGPDASGFIGHDFGNGPDLDLQKQLDEWLGEQAASIFQTYSTNYQAMLASPAGSSSIAAPVYPVASANTFAPLQADSSGWVPAGTQTNNNFKQTGPAAQELPTPPYSQPGFQAGVAEYAQASQHPAAVQANTNTLKRAKNEIDGPIACVHPSEARRARRRYAGTGVTPVVPYVLANRRHGDGRRMLYKTNAGEDDALVLCPVEGCRLAYADVRTTARHVMTMRNEPAHLRLRANPDFVKESPWKPTEMPKPCRYCGWESSSGRSESGKRHEKKCEEKAMRKLADAAASSAVLLAMPMGPWM